MYGVFSEDALISQWTDSGSAEDAREQAERVGGYEDLDVTEVCECGHEHRADECPDQQDINFLERLLEALKR